eukprot:scaffold308_cov327-Pavlova_lutheri.AAC.4
MHREDGWADAPKTIHERSSCNRLPFDSNFESRTFAKDASVGFARIHGLAKQGTARKLAVRTESRATGPNDACQHAPSFVLDECAGNHDSHDAPAQDPTRIRGKLRTHNPIVAFCPTLAEEAHDPCAPHCGPKKRVCCAERCARERPRPPSQGKFARTRCPCREYNTCLTQHASHEAAGSPVFSHFYSQASEID